jgi:hypothetical protein
MNAKNDKRKTTSVIDIVNREKVEDAVEGPTYLYIYAKLVTFFLFSIRQRGRSSRAGGPLSQRSFPAAAKEHASQGPLSRKEKGPPLCFWKERLRKLQAHGPNGGLEERAEWNPSFCSDLDQSTQAIWKG